MATQLPIVLYKYESRTLQGQIIDPANADAPVNSTTAHGGIVSLEWEIKTRPGAADPALFHKDLAGDITWVNEATSSFQIAFNPADLTAIPAGNYWHDVMAQYTDGARFYVFKPAVVQVRDVVNPTDLG